MLKCVFDRLGLEINSLHNSGPIFQAAIIGFSIQPGAPNLTRSKIGYPIPVSDIQMSCRDMTPWASYQIRKIQVAHAPGMPGTVSSPPTSKETVS